ncbi:MAG: response regulator [Polyangiaceae bacterium]|nr:response regulator [Polyangiaceae bacterium]
MAERVLVVDDSPTLRKVVAAILSARAYETVLAADGEAALDALDRERVDLVLLDFVMPRMNGYQFCRELRSRPAHKDLPVVLMSAKGDKIRGQFVQQTGAIDAITKPFDARGLVAVVEGALTRKRDGRARPAPDAAAMLDEDAILDSLRPSAAAAPSSGSAVRALAAAIHRTVVPSLVGSPGVTASEYELGRAVEHAITEESAASIADAARALLGEDVVEGDALSGDIAVISIAEVLQMLQLQRQTGTLRVRARDREIALHVREGTVDLANGRGLPPEFLVGRYLVASGAIDRGALAAELAAPRAGLLGEHLVAKGLVEEAGVRAALAQQTSELIYEVVRWQKGRFHFTTAAAPESAARAALGLPPAGLVMEGFRRVDEWRLIEGSFDFDEVLYRDAAAISRVADSRLTPQEKAVLAVIDGEKTIREIVDEAAGSSFELCKILYQFLNSRLVRRRAA